MQVAQLKLAAAALAVAVTATIATDVSAQQLPRVSWKMQSAFGSNLPHLGPPGQRFEKDVAEMTDGRFVVTSNLLGIDTSEPFPGVVRRQLPYSTGAAEMAEAQGDYEEGEQLYLAAITGYGIWRTRDVSTSERYLSGGREDHWPTIGWRSPDTRSPKEVVVTRPTNGNARNRTSPVPSANSGASLLANRWSTRPKPRVMVWPTRRPVT